MDLFDYENLKDRIFHRKKVCMDTGALEKEAREFRRANNIFEIGDKIFTNDDASAGRVYEIVDKSGGHYKIKSHIGIRYCKEWRIDRHCTDKEIAQGCRDE